MAKQQPETKLCKHCQTEIPYKAKVCPQCGKKVKGGKLKWIIIAIVVIVIIAAVAGGGGDDGETTKVGEVTQPAATQTADTGSNNEENIEESQTDEDNAEVKSVYHVGDILKDGDLEIVYMSSGEYTEDNEFLQPSDGNKYIYIQLAFENTSSKSDTSVSMYSFECYADGYNASMYYSGENTLSATLSAGRSTSGYLYFEVPQDAESIEIEYETNFLTQDKITFAYDGEADSGYVIEANTAATEGAVKVGQYSESKYLIISYLSCFADDSDNMFITPKDGYHFVTCEFELENISDSDKTISSFSFDCYADGVACDASYFREDNLSATLSAGRKAKGTVTFEVPNDAVTVEVEYLSNYWTSNRVVFTVEEG